MVFFSLGEMEMNWQKDIPIAVKKSLWKSFQIALKNNNTTTTRTNIQLSDVSPVEMIPSKLGRNCFSLGNK